MAIGLISYDELASARSTSLDTNGNRSLTRSWIARFNLTSATDTELQKLEYYCEFYNPITWYEAHPAYSAARANKFSASPNTGDLSEWTCKVDYSSDLKRTQPARGDGTGSITAGTTGGTSSPNVSQDNQAPAALRPPEIDITRVSYEVVIEADNAGNKVLNSAGDPFDPPITREASRLAVKLKFWRKPSGFNFLTYFNFNDTVNNAAYSIGGSTFPTKTLRCVVDSVKPVWEVDSSGSPAVQSLSFHWEISITLEYEPNDWRKRLLSAGKRELVSGKLRNITGADGAIVSEPVPLKSDGTKATASDAAYFMPPKDIYPTANFAGLLA